MIYTLINAFDIILKEKEYKVDNIKINNIIYVICKTFIISQNIQVTYNFKLIAVTKISMLLSATYFYMFNIHLNNLKYTYFYRNFN